MMSTVSVTASAMVTPIAFASSLYSCSCFCFVLLYPGLLLCLYENVVIHSVSVVSFLVIGYVSARISPVD